MPHASVLIKQNKEGHVVTILITSPSKNTFCVYSLL